MEQHQLFDFFLIMLVEFDIIFAHEVVALHPAAFRGLAVAVAQPGQHRFADMDATVVDEVHLLDVGTVGGEQLADRPAKEVVADMAEMEGLVGVGRRVFDNHRFVGGFGLLDAVMGIAHPLGYKLQPVAVGNGEVDFLSSSVLLSASVSV